MIILYIEWTLLRTLISSDSFFTDWCFIDSCELSTLALPMSLIPVKVALMEYQQHWRATFVQLGGVHLDFEAVDSGASGVEKRQKS
jgi:hypothetical protein